MGLMVDVEHVVWLTAGRYSTRMDAVNEEIRAAARRFPNLQIAEWGPLSDINGEYTWGDGIHLQPGGADAIAELIRSHLEGEVPWDRLPMGQIATIRDGRRAVTIKGWASNLDLGRATMVRLLVDGELVEKKRTNRKRSGLARKLGSDVEELGYQFKLHLPDGEHEICIEANNFDGFPPVVMDCGQIVLNHNPSGAIDRVVPKTSGDVVRGWVSDPDSKKPVKVQIRAANGATPSEGQPVTGQSLGDVVATDRAARSGSNGLSNFFAIKVPAGLDAYCVVAVNRFGGDDMVLGCPETATQK